MRLKLAPDHLPPIMAPTGVAPTDAAAADAPGTAPAATATPAPSATPATADAPPAHWLADVRTAGPPADWLAKVRAAAPHLLPPDLRPPEPEAQPGQEVTGLMALSASGADLAPAPAEELRGDPAAPAPRTQDAHWRAPADAPCAAGPDGLCNTAPFAPAHGDALMSPSGAPVPDAIAPAHGDAPAPAGQPDPLRPPVPIAPRAPRRISARAARLHPAGVDARQRLATYTAAATQQADATTIVTPCTTALPHPPVGRGGFSDARAAAPPVALPAAILGPVVDASASSPVAATPVRMTPLAPNLPAGAIPVGPDVTIPPTIPAPQAPARVAPTAGEATVHPAQLAPADFRAVASAAAASRRQPPATLFETGDLPAAPPSHVAVWPRVRTLRPHLAAISTSVSSAAPSSPSPFAPASLPWPALLEVAAAEVSSLETTLRAQERRQRLDREQRGDAWNA